MNNQNIGFIWPENDESTKTRLKYDLTAEHIVRSMKSAERKYSTTSLGEVSGLIGLILNLTLSLIVLVIASIIDLVKYFSKKKR